MRFAVAIILLAFTSVAFLKGDAHAVQPVTARCPGESVTLPFSMYTTQAQVTSQRRSAVVRYVARYPAERYSDVLLVKMVPRTREPDSTWYSLGLIGCLRPENQSGPAEVVQKRDWVSFSAVRQGNACQGASGIALLDPTRVRRMQNTSMICAPAPPNPEGTVVSGRYFDRCKFDRTSWRWSCRVQQVYLWARGRSECFRYGATDKHEYEAFMTIGNGVNGTRVAVDEIKLTHLAGNRERHRRDPQVFFEEGTHVCRGQGSCGKTVTHVGIFCASPRCVSATASHRGARWMTNQSCWS